MNFDGFWETGQPNGAEEPDSIDQSYQSDK